MTPAEFRAFRETDLEDVPLQVLISAAEAAIDGFLGELDYLGDRVEIRDGGSRIIQLSRRPASITSITETIGDTVTTLAADDWLLRADGYALERLNNGTNRPSWLWGVPGGWGGRVTVTFAVADDLTDRERVTVGLVGLDLDSVNGANSFTIGQYSESGGSRSGLTYAEARAVLLNSLLPASLMFS